MECRCRFDVVALVWPEAQRAPAVEHFRDAFPAVGRGQFHR